MNAMSVSVPATNRLSTEKFEKPISDAIRTRTLTSDKDGLIHKSLLSCNIFENTNLYESLDWPWLTKINNSYQLMARKASQSLSKTVVLSVCSFKDKNILKIWNFLNYLNLWVYVPLFEDVEC